MTPADPFARLAPFIQEYIWRQGWTEIRAVQGEACSALLDSDDHVLIASGTASGKTEAAFLPILTSLHEDPPASIGVLYIGPLKALINDQFYRLDGLLEESGIPVGAWHGDVSSSRKKQTVEQARGVLQITPESLEGLFLRRGTILNRLFHDLRFVVIDEVHAFMGDERGRQVLCLLERLERVTRVPPRRVGLSATLGDLGLAQAWLAGTTRRAVRVVNDAGARRRLHLALEHFPLHEAEGDQNFSPLDEAPDLYRHLYERTLGRKTLVFRNSRQGVEDTVVALRGLAETRGTPDIYHVHHGSVAAAYREDAERAMREEGRPACTVATVTLELGIDLGQLERVLQVDPPPSVSSFVQRLGRTGRRGGPGEMVFYTLERGHSDKDPPHRRLPWTLLQAIATVQLYLEERWVEPTGQPRLPFSLLVHQTLGALGQYEELAPRDLAARVLTLSPFRHVTQEQYRALLHHLLTSDHLQRTDEGGLILGLAGERLVNDWHFFAVFPDVPEYAVFNGASEIGTVGSAPEVGSVISLIGRAWRVMDVDGERRHVFVRRERGRNTTAWSGGGGEVHDRVVQRMREVLASGDDYAYLQPVARSRLEEARHLARTSGLLDGLVHDLSEGSVLFLPWRGTRVHGTVQAVLAHLTSGRAQGDTPYSIVVGSPRAELAHRVAALPSEEEVRGRLRQAFLAGSHLGGLGKFDALVPRGLLADAHAVDSLDIPTALKDLRSLAV
ncbi:DEAD/DEAH box helicase [Deinococcus metallilatus]|uniref:ATP-dependent Lhr-like helicase n=1 Tax=Deinococcus metallilatus TaxID=1211322 RepID=A0AAJ5F4V9_9DEIO|nr:DEAD/DEAH box helicase [Deinococcus metallilatus]MBB5294671.1 ATP-dependent Lhr-like helicase [Deinococcus metallilatus]QBY07706.1 DEAD/DEAH box helicase [Deinococcus metallilatus]RXJ14122.1 DEAD/DEAH box helicase [Deinococcus metallilatus]TLK30087.1 DEAD/DEAH box helicase [Deinococcus metallilatus]GMA15888.1 ATP-dependent helicase [Deinococcus metallilatus]